MNLANRITIARIISMPVVVFFVLEPYTWFNVVLGSVTLTGRDILAVVLFLIATGSDGIDGYIARSRNMITDFGKFLDPLADKLLISAVLIALVQVHEVPAWVTIVIVTREFAVTGLRLVAADSGEVIAAGTLGKWKTRLQVVAVAAILLHDFPFAYIGIPFSMIMLYVAAAMTIISGVDYFIKNWHVINTTR